MTELTNKKITTEEVVAYSVKPKKYLLVPTGYVLQGDKIESSCEILYTSELPSSISSSNDKDYITNPFGVDTSVKCTVQVYASNGVTSFYAETGWFYSYGSGSTYGAYAYQDPDGNIQLRIGSGVVASSNPSLVNTTTVASAPARIVIEEW